MKHFNLFGISTPRGMIIKTFSSLTPWQSGILRLDASEKCVDPWTTAMKYVDHMEMRGWETVRVDYIKRYQRTQTIYVIVALEKIVV